MSFCCLFVERFKEASMKKRSPIIINVPHSSTFIPEEEKKYFVSERLEHEILVMTDHYCDDLYDVGYEMIRFPVSRLVCDFERGWEPATYPVLIRVRSGSCPIPTARRSCANTTTHITDRLNWR